MQFCRTRSGTLRLVWHGEEILLDAEGRDLPDALAEDIRPHVNVVVVEEAAPEPPPAPLAPPTAPKAKKYGGGAKGEDSSA